MSLLLVSRKRTGEEILDKLIEILDERDRLRREWDRVVTALGPYASPAQSPSDNVADLVQVCTLLDAHVRRMDGLFGEIATIAEEQIGRDDARDPVPPLTDWERVRMLIAQAGDWVSPILWKHGPIGSKQ